MNKINHWVIISGKVEAVAKTRAQIRKCMPDVRKKPTRFEDFLYIGKVSILDKKHFNVTLQA